MVIENFILFIKKTEREVKNTSTVTFFFFNKRQKKNSEFSLYSVLNLKCTFVPVSKFQTVDFLQFLDSRDLSRYCVCVCLCACADSAQHALLKSSFEPVQPSLSLSLSRIYWVCVCAQTRTRHCCKIVSLIWWNFFSEVPRLCSLIYLSSSIEIQLLSFDSVSGSSLKSFYLSGFSLISLLSFLLLSYGQPTPLAYAFMFLVF